MEKTKTLKCDEMIGKRCACSKDTKIFAVVTLSRFLSLVCLALYFKSVCLPDSPEIFTMVGPVSFAFFPCVKPGLSVADLSLRLTSDLQRSLLPFFLPVNFL